MKTKYFITLALCCLTVALSVGKAHAQYAQHSLLSEGTWLKVEIGESGVYKISGDMLPALTNSPTAHIAAYGHRGGELNSLNGDQRIDDLEEMAIEVVDADNNGTFGGGDYILLYATGPDKWEYNTSFERFTHYTHPYSKSNFVYITAQNGPRKRLAMSEALENSTTEVTSCHFLSVYEHDLVNTHHSGQKWVGERMFGNSSSQTVNIQLPTVALEPIKVRYALASVSDLSSQFEVTLNGATRSHAFTKNYRYSVVNEEFPYGGGSLLAFNIKYSYSESMASGYLDFIEVDAKVTMRMAGSELVMYQPDTYGAVKSYSVSNAGSNLRVWDITDFNEVREMRLERGGSSAVFTDSSSGWKQYLAFTPGSYRSPLSIETLACQDIHGMEVPDIVIVSNKRLVSQAQQLASLHSVYDDLTSAVVTQEEVFNEFSGGQTDPIAIREMLRMLRHKSPSGDKPRHLILFGKGTYDNRNLLGHDHTTVVTYQSVTSFDDDGESVTTDDIFTYLDDGESLSSYASMDISVGRLPAKNEAEATSMVGKIGRYMGKSDLQLDGIRGDWRNCVALLADDADPTRGGDTAFTRSSEITANQITQRYPQYAIDKIYADAYVQQTGADGSYYPDVNNALKRRMDYGCMLLNYIGHGSSQYIGTERFMMKSHISNYTNYDQLPFFITSTCTFGRHDDPDETCGAEEFLLASGAGIACLAASRPISHVQAVNTDMVLEALNPGNTIGEAIRIAKNKRFTTQALTLIGDPALSLSHPTHHVVITAINGRQVDSTRGDSVLVLSTVTVDGEIRDAGGNLVDDFDGIIYPEIYDRPRKVQTLANDNEGCEVTFNQQNSLIYKGHTNVTGGKFRYQFTVPRDVAYKFEKARMLHYAKNNTEDATGAYLNLYVGGFDESVDLHETRPAIELYMNDTNFRNGGITDANPTLLAMLFDSIGINAVGSGLGHDITATIDNNPNKIIVLNDLYDPDIDDEQRGTIRYSLENLSPGRHSITVKVWNIFNYSNTAEISFIVMTPDTTETHFSASPNPTTGQAMLRMEHNAKGRIESARLDIYNMRGQRVRSFTPQPGADSYVVGPVTWNLRGESGTRVSPGIYMARFTAHTSDGETLTSCGKIVVM